jgi:hypothetical protein
MDIMKLRDLITVLQKAQSEHGGDILVTTHKTGPDRDGPGSVMVVQSVDSELFWEFSDQTLCTGMWSSEKRVKALFIK